MKSPMHYLVLALLLCAGSVLAAEFKNIGSGPVIMYDAPSTRGQKLYVAPKGMPVEVLLNYGSWSKVRDFAGDTSWVEIKQLSERKNVLVRNLNAKIRNSAEESAEVVFSADKGVMLEIIEPVNAGWIKVRHSDGASGFVKASEIWGV